jgi:hypothetical protein
MNVIFTLEDVLAPVQRALRLTAADDIKLAVGRIDAHHRELCGMADWPALRAVKSVTSVTGANVEIENAAGVSSVAAGSTLYWFVESWDVTASDLAGRRLWCLGTPARNTAGSLVIDVWDWDDVNSLHVRSTGTALTIAYWLRPGPLVQASDRLALPSMRLLTVRVILDLVGLMDRKDVDVAPWRADLEPAMNELRAMNPVAQAQTLRLVSGRILMRSPLR